jgi:hypothetical protein
VADGADVTLGAKADAAAAADTSTATQISLFKRLLQRVTTLIGLLPAALVGGRLDVNLGAAPATVTADTELPAAAALNGTIVKSVSAPVVGAALLVSDNTNLVQPLGDAANGLDVDVTRLPALVAGSAVIGKVGIDQTTPGTTNLVDTELPAAAALADAAANPTAPAVDARLSAHNGATWDRLRVPSKFIDLNAVAIGTIATVWTPAGGKKFRLMGGSFSLSAAASVLFEDNAGGATVGGRTPKLVADTPYNFDWGNGVLSGAADRVLKATSSAAANITGTLYGCEE